MSGEGGAVSGGFLVALFIYILASLVLVVAKAAQVAKQLDKGTYSFKGAMPLFVIWFLLLLPGIQSTCTVATCQYGMNFGWWMDMLNDMKALNGYDPDTTPVIVILLFGILWVHVLGHFFGWLFHGGYKLWQAEA